MKNIVKAVALIAGIAILAGNVAFAQGRGRENGPPTTPPGQERKVLSVPEPATLTLIGVVAGSGLLLHQWRSRRRKNGQR